MTLYPKLILDALATVRYPGTGKNLVEAEMVADNLRIDGMSVSFSLIFEKPNDPFMKSMVKAAETAIHTYVSPDVQVTIATEINGTAVVTATIDVMGRNHLRGVISKLSDINGTIEVKRL